MGESDIVKVIEMEQLYSSSSAMWGKKSKYESFITELALH